MATEQTNRVVVIPIASGEWPILTFPFPMTETQWAEMTTMLEAMKPGMVKAPQPDSTDAQGVSDDAP